MPRKPALKAPLSNTDFLVELMDFAKSGPLMQAFIITAIEKYAERCIAAGPETFHTDFLSGRAWVACAVEARDKIKARP